MSDSPLSKYCRASAAKGSDNTKSQEGSRKRAYVAYDATDKLSSFLEIRCLTQPSQAPQSRFLMAVVFSADYDEAISLIYSFMAVEIKGKNLKEVRRAIQNGRCEFIQEYHENDFANPAKNDPVITSIKFIAGEKLDDILASHRGKTK